MFVAEGWRGKVGVGYGEGVVACHLDPLERAGVDEAAHDGVADVGVDSELADGALAALDRGEGLGALRGRSGRSDPGGAIFDHHLRPGERGGRRQDHPQHRGQRREVIIRGPFGEAAQRGPDRRDVDQSGERAKAIVADFLGGNALRLPYDADQLARAERGDHHATGLDVHPVGNAIIKRSERGVEGDYSGAGKRHGAALTCRASCDGCRGRGRRFPRLLRAAGRGGGRLPDRLRLPRPNPGGSDPCRVSRWSSCPTGGSRQG